MADVFISYAREDSARAELVANGLQGAGIDVFWDSEIPPGQSWADYIEGKLSDCRAVIVLWSENSTRSQWVREEARMGRDKGKLIPAALDSSPPPFGFGEVQAANLKDWNGQAGHPDWERLLGAVRNAVGGMAASSTMPPLPRVQPAMSPPPRSRPIVSPGESKPWFRNPWVLGGGGVLALLLVLGIIGSMGDDTSAPVQQFAAAPVAPIAPTPAAPAATNDTYMEQLNGQLQHAAQIYAQQGFQPVGAPYTNSLAAGGVQQLPAVMLNQGVDYRILAVCDNDCSDVDLTVFDQNNNQVAQDALVDDHPVVQIVPRWTGPFTVHVTMATCTVPPCFYAAQLYAKPAG